MKMTITISVKIPIFADKNGLKRLELCTLLFFWNKNSIFSIIDYNFYSISTALKQLSNFFRISLYLILVFKNTNIHQIIFFWIKPVPTYAWRNIVALVTEQSLNFSRKSSLVCTMIYYDQGKTLMHSALENHYLEK